MSSQLAALQQALAAALMDPTAQQRLHAYVKDPAGPPAAMPKGAAHEDRLGQSLGRYRGNLRAHWRSALAGAYPVILALVGDAYFDALTWAYAQACPSCSGDLNRFGAQLPAFIDAYETDPRFRYFSDVARLEWSLHTAYYAADVIPYTIEQWLDVGEARLLHACVSVHPACHALASPYPTAHLWRAHQDGGSVPAELDAPAWTLTVRPQWRPLILEQTEAAHAAFLALQHGATVNQSLDAAFAIDAHFDFATQWRTWIRASAITGLL